MRKRLCEDCNSEIITVKHKKFITIECSYCGKVYDEIILDEDDTNESQKDLS